MRINLVDAASDKLSSLNLIVLGVYNSIINVNETYLYLGGCFFKRFILLHQAVESRQHPSDR